MRVEDLLKPEQKKHWETMLWLTDEGLFGHGTGRTTLLVLAFIHQADQHIGRNIRVFDHYPHGPNIRYVLDGIESVLKRLVKDDPEWGAKEFDVNRNKNTITRLT